MKVSAPDGVKVRRGGGEGGASPVYICMYVCMNVCMYEGGWVCHDSRNNIASCISMRLSGGSSQPAETVCLPAAVKGVGCVRVAFWHSSL